mgnify:CR=1 FL=1
MAEKEAIEVKEEPKLGLWLVLVLVIITAIIVGIRYKSKKR